MNVFILVSLSPAALQIVILDLYCLLLLLLFGVLVILNKVCDTNEWLLTPGFQFTSRVQWKWKQIGRAKSSEIKWFRICMYTYVSCWKAPYNDFYKHSYKMNHSSSFECMYKFSFSCTPFSHIHICLECSFFMQVSDLITFDGWLSHHNFMHIEQAKKNKFSHIT